VVARINSCASLWGIETPRAALDRRSASAVWIVTSPQHAPTICIAPRSLPLHASTFTPLLFSIAPVEYTFGLYLPWKPSSPKLSAIVLRRYLFGLETTRSEPSRRVGRCEVYFRESLID